MTEKTSAKPTAPKAVRTFSGTVVSDAMDKTVVVQVERAIRHAKYHKRFVTSQRYKVHDEKNQYKEGDTVRFVQCRPLSKDKRWRVLYN